MPSLPLEIGTILISRHTQHVKDLSYYIQKVKGILNTEFDHDRLNSYFNKMTIELEYFNEDCWDSFDKIKQQERDQQKGLVSEVSKRQYSTPCAFCKSFHHRSNSCEEISNPVSRLQIITNCSLCPNCLGPHRLARCASRHRCRICQQKHHSKLHGAMTSQSSSSPTEKKVEPSIVIHLTNQETQTQNVVNCETNPSHSHYPHQSENVICDNSDQTSTSSSTNCANEHSVNNISNLQDQKPVITDFTKPENSAPRNIESQVNYIASRTHKSDQDDCRNQNYEDDFDPVEFKNWLLKPPSSSHKFVPLPSDPVKEWETRHKEMLKSKSKSDIT